MKKIALQSLSLVLLLGTLWFVDYQVGWRHIADQWSTLSPMVVALLLALTLTSYALRAKRVSLSMSLSAHPFRQVLYISTTHNLWNILLPMRTGEASFVVLLKHHYGLSVTQSTTHLLYLRLLDLLVLLGTALSIGLGQLSWWYTLTGLVAMLAIILMLPVCRQWLLHLLGSAQSGWRYRLYHACESLPGCYRTHSYISLLSMAAWLCKLMAFLILLIQLVPAELHTLILPVVGAELSSVLPIHGIAGAGTFEAAFVGAGLHSELSGEQLLQAAVTLHIYLLSMACIAALLAWAWFHLSRRNMTVSSIKCH